ncbi:MAG: transcriptional regulator, MerR family [Acidimicrobiales bacterium]|nr:transcriptional regulator, MerR family [Acidimicrobiales bacterium]
MSPETLLRIGEVARRAGVSTRTLRYYQELGLLDPTGHSPGGNRRYSEEDLARVLRIRELQLVMGFPLDRIGSVLSAEDRLAELRHESQRGVTKQRRVEILREAMDLNRQVRVQVEERVAALATFVDDLDEKATRYRTIAAELGVDLDDPKAAPTG